MSFRDLVTRRAAAKTSHIVCDQDHDADETTCFVLHFECPHCGKPLHLALFGDGEAKMVHDEEHPPPASDHVINQTRGDEPTTLGAKS